MKILFQTYIKTDIYNEMRLFRVSIDISLLYVFKAFSRELTFWWKNSISVFCYIQ